MYTVFTKARLCVLPMNVYPNFPVQMSVPPIPESILTRKPTSNALHLPSLSPLVADDTLTIHILKRLTQRNLPKLIHSHHQRRNPHTLRPFDNRRARRQRNHRRNILGNFTGSKLEIEHAGCMFQMHGGGIAKTIPGEAGSNGIGSKEAKTSWNTGSRRRLMGIGRL